MGWKWILVTPRELINPRLFKSFKYNKYVSTTCCLLGEDPILGAEGKMQDTVSAPLGLTV